MNRKLFHLVKMSWMFSWRLLIVSVAISAGRLNDAVIPVAVILAAVMIFGFNKALRTWPLARLLTRALWLIPADTWGPESQETHKKYLAEKEKAWHRKQSRKNPSYRLPTKLRPKIENWRGSASEQGRMTGFEPKFLQSDPVPVGVLMRGKPGENLGTGSDFSQENIDLGKAGEENFAKALAKTRLLNRFFTAWSVPVPDKDAAWLSANAFGWDIDCVLVTGSTIYLVDLKNYKGGSVKYETFEDMLYCFDIPTGDHVDEPKQMSKNMFRAAATLRKHFPDLQIAPVVVFMPTNKGEALLDDVFWPGMIPAMNLAQFLDVLSSQPDYDTTYQSRVASAGLSIAGLRDKW